MKEVIAEEAISLGVFNLPWVLWVTIIGAISSITWKIIRLFFRVSTLEKQTDYLKEHNAKQDKKFEALVKTANDTNMKVSEIVGYIEGKKNV